MFGRFGARAICVASATTWAGGTILASAEAADLGGAPPAYYDAAPRSNIERWTGFYLGGTAGYGWGNARANGDIGKFPFAESGALGTVFMGYNWQFGRAVLGVEADLGTGDFGASKPTGFGTLNTSLNAYGSFRGRAGYLVTPALLLYGTAGLAWSNMDFGISGLSSQSQTFWGVAYGLGGEWKVSDTVALRLEYLRTDLDREVVNHSGLIDSYDPSFSSVRAGISFKF